MNPLQPAVETRADVVEAIYAAGHLLHARERWADAAAVFRLMLRASPGDERGWLALGDCHHKAGQPLIALELYGAGTVAAAPAARCRLARVRLLRELGREDEADAWWDELLGIAEQSGDDTTRSLVEAERECVS